MRAGGRTRFGPGASSATGTCELRRSRRVGARHLGPPNELVSDSPRGFQHVIARSGDTLHVITTVLSRRESKSRPEAGIVEFRHETFNQDDVLVAACIRQAFMRKKPVG